MFTSFDEKAFWEAIEKKDFVCLKVNTVSSILNDPTFARGETMKVLEILDDKVPEIFEETRKLIEEDSIYQEYDIKVEHYIVSTGLSQVIKGSVVVQYVKGIWGCELIEEEIENGEKIISEIGYTIDNTSKTRALFEINKGVNRHEGVEVNTKMPEELRRVPFRNMIYVADGPSDIPAFSLSLIHI